MQAFFSEYGLWLLVALLVLIALYLLFGGKRTAVDTPAIPEKPAEPKAEEGTPTVMVAGDVPTLISPVGDMMPVIIPVEEPAEEAAKAPPPPPPSAPKAEPKPEPEVVAAKAKPAAAKAAPKPKPAPKAKAKAEAVAKPAAKTAPKPAPAAKAAAKPKVEAKPAAAPKPAAKRAAAPKPKAETKPAAVAKPKAEAPKPAPAPKAAPAKAAVPDDLLLLKGVGPKVKAILAQEGITRFDQVAAWKAKDLEAINAKLGNFAGRPERENWVDQAKLLAKGDTAGFEAKYGKL